MHHEISWQFELTTKRYTKYQVFFTAPHLLNSSIRIISCCQSTLFPSPECIVGSSLRYAPSKVEPGLANVVTLVGHAELTGRWWWNQLERKEDEDYWWHRDSWEQIVERTKNKTKELKSTAKFTTQLVSGVDINDVLFVDFWSDASLDPVAFSWSMFIDSELRSTINPVLLHSDNAKIR